MSAQPEVSPTGRARRFDAGVPQLTQRDAELVSWVVEMVGMPLDLLRLAAGGMSEAAARKMVRRWRAAGWVESRKLEPGPWWVLPTRAGIDTFGRHAYDLRPPSVARLAHLREVIVARIWFGLRLAATGVREWRWVSERQLRWELAADLKSAASRAHVVDGVVEYADDQGQLVRTGVEVELSPKAFGVLRANLTSGADQHQAAFWFVNDRTRALVERAKAEPYASHSRVEIRHMDDVHDLIRRELT